MRRGKGNKQRQLYLTDGAIAALSDWLVVRGDAPGRLFLPINKGGRIAGSGIAPADLERVFERFYRADASRTRASGGFGLGLAIARDLVEAMGGTITVESIVGEGSCFYVRLPIATGDQEPMTNAEQ